MFSPDQGSPEGSGRSIYLTASVGDFLGELGVSEEIKGQALALLPQLEKRTAGYLKKRGIDLCALEKVGCTPYIGLFGGMEVFVFPNGRRCLVVREMREDDNRRYLMDGQGFVKRVYLKWEDARDDFWGDWCDGEWVLVEVGKQEQRVGKNRLPAYSDRVEALSCGYALSFDGKDGNPRIVKLDRDDFVWPVK